MTKNRKFLFHSILISVISMMTIFTSCDDTTSVIGPALVNTDMVIHMDSGFNIKGKSLRVEEMDTRSTVFLVGKMKIPGYGTLTSSFVTQLLSSTAMTIPDTIPIDSVSGMRMTLHYRRGALTGDSLAPNRLAIYQLTKQLPADITSNFNPEGYYNPTPLGSHSYTASALGRGDTLFLKDSYGHIRVEMPEDFAKKIFKQYRDDPSVFQWPSTFNEYFPGIFVNNILGSGCIVNIAAIECPLYYKYGVQKTVAVDSVTTAKVWVSATDSVTLFSTAPEVLASTNFHYEMDPAVAEYANKGDVISVSPCGYIPEIVLPLDSIIEKYKATEANLMVVNNLILTIPGEKMSNDYNLAPPGNMLMVRKCDYETFFAENKLPDNSKKSFWGSYNSSTGLYTFTSMRQFITDLISSGEAPTEDDATFLLVPVDITTESLSYGGYNDTFVTSCTPFINTPTLVKLNLEDAKLMFTFSSQKAY